jgi:hypothetical protein
MLMAVFGSICNHMCDLLQMERRLLCVNMNVALAIVCVFIANGAKIIVCECVFGFCLVIYDADSIRRR